MKKKKLEKTVAKLSQIQDLCVKPIYKVAYIKPEMFPKQVRDF